MSTTDEDFGRITSITDELRKSINEAIWVRHEDGVIAHVPKDRLLAIADRIEKQAAEIYNEGFVTARDMFDAHVEELYVKRPLDAHEEPILRGDRMVDRDGYRFTADWFEFFGDEEWSVHDAEDNSFEPSECLHRQVAPWQVVLDHAKRKAGDDE